LHADRQATEKKRPQVKKILLPPAARLKNEERPSRSEQRTVRQTHNNRLDRKSPIQVMCEPRAPGRRSALGVSRGASTGPVLRDPGCQLHDLGSIGNYHRFGERADLKR
jgi:hypothetical protein